MNKTVCMSGKFYGATSSRRTTIITITATTTATYFSKAPRLKHLSAFVEIGLLFNWDLRALVCDIIDLKKKDLYKKKE